MFQVSVSDIGEFVQHKSCQRRFKLNHNHAELFRAAQLGVRPSDVDPVLQASGRQREDEWEASLRRAGLLEVAQPYPGEQGIEWMEFIQQLDLMPPDEQGFAREVVVEGRLGAFDLRGRMDFVIAGVRAGQPFLRLVECKASRRDKTYHRVQATLYRMLVRRSLSQMPVFVGGMPVEPHHIECVVVRVDESTHAIQSILETQPFASAEALEADLARLLADEGLLAAVLRSDLDTLPFQLEPRCDACGFAPHCLTTTARRRGVELLSLPPTLVEVLRRIRTDAFPQGVTQVDQLADLATQGDAADQIRRQPDFSANLETLVKRAQAFRTRLDGQHTTVQPIPNAGAGQLPTHEVVDLGAHPSLLRVFLSVTYDYVENRIVGLVAHVTDASERCEVGPAGMQTEGGDRLNGVDVIKLRRAAWTGDYAVDNGAELGLLQDGFREIVEALEFLAADSPTACVHFYVWSRYELTQLVEAAGRLGSGLLGAMRELLGCRDRLEQLIYSSLQFEVTSRFATGWTSTGLVACLATQWQGRSFHWRRKIGEKMVDLAEVFSSGIFDFVQSDGEGTTEIRAHFSDNLPAPYWHAYWGTLPDSEAALAFDGARAPYVLQTYLQARAHALRWLEESIEPKNRAIAKYPVVLRELPKFKLGTENAVQAAVDFLRFDQHVGYTDWVRDHLTPPWVRVAIGVSVPVRDLKLADERGFRIHGHLDPDNYGQTLETLRAKSGLEEGAFVRLNEVVDPHLGLSPQALSWGRTCRVDAVDWVCGRVELSLIVSNTEDVYTPRSWRFSAQYPPYARGTLDASIADFVSRRVEQRLVEGPGRRVQPAGAHVLEWFDPTRPNIPAVRTRPAPELAAMLDTRMSPQRRALVLEGIASRIQLMQGPPGTGKTTLTAAALCARLASLSTSGVVLISANTHTAVDTLLSRARTTLDEWPQMSEHLRGLGRLPEFFKTGGDAPDGVRGLSALQADVDRHRDHINGLLRKGVIPVVGGTTGGILKFAQTVGAGIDGSRGHGFLSPLLIVDEASMMPFAHFLALASHVHPDGQMMLAGDHRQLSPIVSHDWAREDRPPAVLYHPHVSAFEALRALHARVAEQPKPQGRITSGGLEVTYRLPSQIRELIQPVYTPDGIELRAPEGAAEAQAGDVRGLADIWTSGRSLFLVLHDERGSRNANRFEVALARQILDSAPALPENSVAVMTPHRAQRALLKDALGPWQAAIAMVDTVERLQGGECPTILFSATVSDPVAISQNEAFILDMNRSNVAFSRTKERLIVMCSRALLDHIPESVEGYEAAVLWKYLRQRCARRVATLECEGRPAELWVP